MASAVSRTTQNKLILAFMEFPTSLYDLPILPPFDFIDFLFPVMLPVLFRSSAFTLEVVMNLGKVTRIFL